MKNTDYKKLTNILLSLSQMASDSVNSKFLEPTKLLVSKAGELAERAVNDIAEDSVNQHQYTDALIDAIGQFRTVQDNYSALCKDLFSKKLWPALDNICPPEPMGDPVFLRRLQQSDDYQKAIKSGTLSASYVWRGTIADLVRWLIDSRLLREPKPGCLETSTIRWRDADKVFIIKGKRVTAQQLAGTAAQLSHRDKKTDEIQA